MRALGVRLPGGMPAAILRLSPKTSIFHVARAFGIEGARAEILATERARGIDDGARVLDTDGPIFIDLVVPDRLSLAMIVCRDGPR